MEDLVARKIKDRYRVQSLIGRGGMAEVYKVWDEVRADTLAMKVLREDLAQDKIFLRRFEREAQTLAKLQHRSIVRFYGLERDDLLVFLLMDYIEGTSLREEIFRASVPFSIERVLEMLRPVCAAMHYAHQVGIVHCDLKPGNILINTHGEILVTDFGIARMLDAATSTMVGIGTPAYMAPELIMGQDPTPQTDVYALGVILYEMLSGGERPFTGERAETTGSTAERIRWEQLKLAPCPPREFNSEIPDEAMAVILRCLKKGPIERYADIQEIYETFARIDQKNKKNVKSPQEVQAISPKLVVEKQDYVKPSNKEPASTEKKIEKKEGIFPIRSIAPESALLEHMHTEEVLIHDFDIHKNKIVICFEQWIAFQELEQHKIIKTLDFDEFYEEVRYSSMGKNLILKGMFKIDELDIGRGEIIQNLQQSWFSEIISYDLVDDGQFIISILNSGKMTCWGKNNGLGYRELNNYRNRFIQEVRTVPKKKIEFLKNINNEMIFLSVPSFAEICKIECDLSGDIDSAFSPTGQFLAVWDQFSSIKIFDVNAIIKYSGNDDLQLGFTETELLLSEISFEDTKENIGSITFSPTGKTLFIMCTSGTLKVLETETLREISSQDTGIEGIGKMMVSEDGGYLVTLCKGQRLDYWKLNWQAV